MEIIKIKDEFIKLGQVLKLSGMAESGIDAKIKIQEGLVKVNGETEYQRGKKIRSGDIVEYNKNSIKVENE